MKSIIVKDSTDGAMSPSMRREWIEMKKNVQSIERKVSPSMRREWIEMTDTRQCLFRQRSPSMRREWIEMHVLQRRSMRTAVSLHAEGVD